MILVDTTVVIDYARGKDVKLAALLPTLPVATCGVVRAELLWDTIGDNLATLRRSGITVPIPDAVIATLGIENDIEVWARDPHYRLMQRQLSRLRLFQEPP